MTNWKSTTFNSKTIPQGYKTWILTKFVNAAIWQSQKQKACNKDKKQESSNFFFSLKSTKFLCENPNAFCKFTSIHLMDKQLDPWPPTNSTKMYLSLPNAIWLFLFSIEDNQSAASI